MGYARIRLELGAVINPVVLILTGTIFIDRVIKVIFLSAHNTVLYNYGSVLIILTVVNPEGKQTQGKH